jgi:two-component system LytT family sensor kinase
MTLTTRSHVILRHIAFIAAYFSYEVGMLYAYTGEMVYFSDAFWHLLVNLCLFYTNALFILPFAGSCSGHLKRIYIGVLLLVLGFTAFLLLKYLLSIGYDFFHIDTTRPYIDFPSFLRDTTWRFINISGLSFGYWFAANSMKKQQEVARLEQEKLKDQLANETTKNELIAIENDLLKSKINFHFLFNTLSYLYDSVKAVDLNAGSALMALSDILHYSLSTPSDGKVRLQEEIKYVGAMFKITTLKSSGKLSIDFSVSGRAGNLEIIPLVLVTLCENILKYAELRDTASPAHFQCDVNDATLSIHISNKKRKAISPISYGMGMKNTEKRLQVAYPARHQLEVTDSEDTYQLKLFIQLS